MVPAHNNQNRPADPASFAGGGVGHDATSPKWFHACVDGCIEWACEALIGSIVRLGPNCCCDDELARYEIALTVTELANRIEVLAVDVAPLVVTEPTIRDGGEPWEHRQGPLARWETGSPPWPELGDSSQARHVGTVREREAIAAAVPSTRQRGE